MWQDTWLPCHILLPYVASGADIQREVSLFARVARVRMYRERVARVVYRADVCDGGKENVHVPQGVWNGGHVCLPRRDARIDPRCL